MKCTYKSEDVELLLKDITNLVTPLSTAEREQNIQSGVHYCEMLPLEYKPSKTYMQLYHMALERYAKLTADATALVAEKMYRAKGKKMVIVSLARAGIPVGILIRRYLLHKYHVDCKHYAISIIRGRGIDHQAMKYMLSKHDAKDIQFVDGWVGKGAIFHELEKELEQYPNVDKRLAVLSDPANLTALCGTHEDFLIPSSCLNSTITGLLSRTFLRDDIIKAQDFHGVAFYSELAQEDESNRYVDCIEQHFDYHIASSSSIVGPTGMEIVHQLQAVYQIDNINFIKPGIGETTRVLLRRIPWKILINGAYADCDELKPIRQLAAEKNIVIEISKVDLGNYKSCGIIKKMADI